MRKLKHEEIPRPDPDEIDSLPRHPISVVADNIRSIYNVGSFFRTADAARVDHLYLTGYTGTPDHRKLRKTALGAQEAVPWSHHESARAVVEELKTQDVRIGVLELTTDPTSIDQITLDDFPLCLILGNELHGVDEGLIDMADYAFEIEQFGVKQSLNVSVAFGIAVFDLVRRYRQLNDLVPHPYKAENH